MNNLTWPGSILIAVITAIVSCVVSGLVASLAVTWYRVSQFEGGSSYFVLFIALGSFVAGLVLGLIVARAVAVGAHPGFGKGLGFALLLVFAINGAVAGVSRLLADVPPTIAGEELMLLVEIRWPASQLQSPALDTIPRHLDLGALSDNGVRVSKVGALWLEDARRENGQWIVPGAVEVFTERGKRILTVRPALPEMPGFLVPLSAHPDAQSFAWSDWIPRVQPVGPPAGNGSTYRFKIVPRSQASRVQQIGPFEVSTVVSKFFVGADRAEPPTIAATATFEVRTQSQLVTDSAGQPLATIDAVATLPGEPNALLVHAGGMCVLLQHDGRTVHSTSVSECEYMLQAEVLTNDDVWRAASRHVRKVQGLIDRESFMHVGAYLFTDAILDAATRLVHPISTSAYTRGFYSDVPPFGVSPDGRSFVRLGYSESDQRAPALLVFESGSLAPYLVAIDRPATRYTDEYGVDGRWLAHYYQWAADVNGHDHLAARVHMTPLPFRGVMHFESDGTPQYRVVPVTKAMLQVLRQFLQTELQAHRTPDDEQGSLWTIHIGANVVHVSYDESDHYVSVYVEPGYDMTVVPTIAARFDALLARGAHDALFDYTLKP